ncbi:MAG: PD-(D/E)XK nuclease family protein [Anaerolineales bacterium]
MIEHLSYSSVSMYLDCPEAWRRKYIAKEPTRTTSALAFGSAFHGTIERMIQDSQRDWQNVWREEFGKAFTEVALEQDETPEQHYNEGVRMLSNSDVQAAIATIKPRHDDAGAMIERKVELHVPGVPVPVIGYIDVILEDGTPADFKTSARSWTQEQANNSLQTLFYLAALNQAGFDVNWRFRHFVFVKTKTPQVQVLEHSHTPGELFFLFEMVKRVWIGIEKEFFPLNPTTWRCSEKYCDFYANCRGRYV